MSDQILPEIVSDILSRCDVGTIGRCKCISKQWRGIIESTHFMKLQLNYATNTNSAAVFFFKELFDETLFQAPLSNLDMRSVPTISQVKPFSLVGSCNGLFLLNKNETQDFCILNPISNRHAYLPNLLPCPFVWSDVAVLAYGLGYDSRNDDYKVVRIAQAFDPRTSDVSRTDMTITCVNKRAIIYDKLPYFMEISAKGLFVGGVLHWLMAKYNHGKMLLIMGYDVGIDEIRELPLPDLKDELKELEYEGRVGLGLLGTWLSISTMAVGFWAMKEYGIQESWTKLFSFSLAHMSCEWVRPLGSSENDNLVLLELDMSLLIWYDRKAKDVRNLVEKSLAEAMVCFRTIAPLPSAEKTDETNQSSQDHKRSTRKKRDNFLSKGFKLKL